MKPAPALRVPLKVVLQKLKAVKTRYAPRAKELAEEASAALQALVSLQQQMEDEASEIDHYYRRRKLDGFRLHFTAEDPYCVEDNILETCQEAVEEIVSSAAVNVCCDR